jgi:hypothetical protein
MHKKPRARCSWPFFLSLVSFGYIEGQNIIIEYRHEAGGFERLPERAAELIGQKASR